LLLSLLQFITTRKREKNVGIGSHSHKLQQKNLASFCLGHCTHIACDFVTLINVTVTVTTGVAGPLAAQGGAVVKFAALSS